MKVIHESFERWCELNLSFKQRISKSFTNKNISNQKHSSVLSSLINCSRNSIPNIKLYYKYIYYFTYFNKYISKAIFVFTS